MTEAEELRKLIESFEQSAYYVSLKKNIEFDIRLLRNVELAKIRLVELEKAKQE